MQLTLSIQKELNNTAQERIYCQIEVSSELERVRVLIADNSAFERIMLANTLRTLGFEVVATAKDSSEVVDKCIQVRPDIVLIDLALADRNITGVIRNLVNYHPSGVVILLVSEHSVDPDMIVEAVTAGAKAYVEKPLASSELKARIASALKRR